MALLFMDSFDHYATADLTAKYASTTGGLCGILVGDGRRSSNCLNAVNGGITATLPVAPSGAVAIVGVAYKQASGTFANGEFDGLQIKAGTTVQLTLTLSTTGVLKVYRGPFTALLGTASTPLTLGAFDFLELQTTLDAAAGTVVVRVNETVVLNLTGVNTAQTGVGSWSGLTLNALQPGTSSNRFDDLYVLDGSGAAPWNTLLGDCRVDVCAPTGAGATTGWTPSTGANWQTVDDATPNGDTDYTSTLTVPATDTFVMQDAPLAGATIYGVQQCLAMKKLASGICTIAPVIRHASTDYPGAALSPGTAYTYGLQIAATNPGTGAAWTETDFNAAEFGYRRLT